MCIIFSKIFPGSGSKEIGLKLPTLFLFPVLGVGITVAFFHAFGKIKELIDKFKIAVRIVVKVLKTNFKTLDFGKTRGFVDIFLHDFSKDFCLCSFFNFKYISLCIIICYVFRQCSII